MSDIKREFAAYMAIQQSITWVIDCLRRTAETRTRHERMAEHPFQSLPPLVVSLVPEQIDVGVEVGLQAGRVHTDEPP